MHLNKKSYLKFIFVLLFAQVASGELPRLKLERLNPHGSQKNDLKKMSLDRHAECKACHYKKGKDFQLRPYMQQRCTSCHNSFPHSGVVEHIGKNLSKLKGVELTGKVECLSCHRPHRALLENTSSKKYLRHQHSNLDDIEGLPSFLKIQKEEQKLPQGLVERTETEVMLRRTCTDCHKWGDKK
ncbi:MAG: cytochrome c3 family protein [Deltaproteobacteria bacterium]|nr:cytochrome c3 family protein [Deltaproteobacteria bacterium]